MKKNKTVEEFLAAVQLSRALATDGLMHLLLTGDDCTMRGTLSDVLMRYAMVSDELLQGFGQEPLTLDAEKFCGVQHTLGPIREAIESLETA
jgi:hypothetical protein